MVITDTISSKHGRYVNNCWYVDNSSMELGLLPKACCMFETKALWADSVTARTRCLINVIFPLFTYNCLLFMLLINELNLTFLFN